MNIFITGASGFIGSNIKKYFQNEGHIVFAPPRSEVNMLNFNTFLEWYNTHFKTHTIDAVIHCAGSGGRRNGKDVLSLIHQNCAMAHNAYQIKQFFGEDCKLFLIGSGAEQNRTVGAQNLVGPKDVPNNTDFYGLSKATTNEFFSGILGVCNLRAFGVFGEDEEPQRFIRTVMHHLKHKMAIEIPKDRRMDFFYVEDIARIIEAMTEHYPNAKLHDVNLSYPQDRMLNLSKLADYILTFEDYDVDVNVGRFTDRDYFGSPVGLKELFKNVPDLELVGQKEGLRRTYESF